MPSSSTEAASLDPQSAELIRKMGTPSRLAMTTCKGVLGFEFAPARHILHMERKLLAAIGDTSRRRFVSISMPPRHGKSIYCSVFLAAWFLGMYPEKNVILISYSEDYALQWGRVVRDILTRYGKPLFGRTVDKGASSNTDWKMERSIGGMISVGVGGGITGRGGDLIIIDDLIKNRQEAASDATKKYQTRASIDALVWAALYQQNPALSSDLMFRPENWQEYPNIYRRELMGSCSRLVRVWDLAASDKKGDWTVGCLMGLHRSGLLYVFDVIRMRKNATAVEEIVLETAKQDGAAVKILIEQERAGAGKSVLQHYQKMLMGYIVAPAQAEASKESRAQTYSSKQGAGLIYIPDESAWKKDWVKEHEGFPNIRHDDQVDTGAYAFNELTLGWGGESAFFSPVQSPRPLVWGGDPQAAALALMARG
jgi:predicted phage terminase large subunit-like protein